MNKLRLIEVPEKSKDHYITDHGSLIFWINTENKRSSNTVTADFILDKNLHEIVDIQN